MPPETEIPDRTRIRGSGKSPRNVRNSGGVAARRWALTSLVLAAFASPVPASSPAAEPLATSARPTFRDGQAQVVAAFTESSAWIRESLWVETEFDSDGDGRRDRVFTDVTRPGQTDSEGLRVPVIYESSPYYAGIAESKGLNWDVRQEVGAVPPARTDHTRVPYQPGRTNVSTGLVKTWVPRGFAVVHSDAPGTGLSDGWVTIGGPPEALAPKAVIDWLNGRARGFRTREGTEEVRATRWCTGKVGMIGTSYNGTLALAAATTGVKGLEAIVPVAPNTSYYHYYRSHGLVRHPGGWLGEDIDSLYDAVRSGEPARAERGDAQIRDGVFARGRDRQGGDYNAFWAERDLLKQVRGVKAAVLMAHAFNDWNVVPEHSVRIASALKGRVPLRMYFHQGGHGGDPPLAMVNRWFSRFLYDIPNGVDQGPRAWIMREPTQGQKDGAPQLPTPYADYPNPAASVVTLHPGTGGSAMGPLGLRVPRKQGMETLVDNVEIAGAALAAAAASGHRLLYATPELLSPVHLSGTPRITLRLASSKPAANLSVWLVVLPWTDGPIGPANVITRGWADPQNHASLKSGGDYHARRRGEPLVPGRFYRLTFDLQPDDQVIPAGKRIGLMIFSSDRDFTLWPQPGTELTVDLDGTSLRLPVVGGRSWFAEAVGKE